MKIETEKIVKILTDEYNIPQEKISIEETSENDEADSITIGETSYHIYGGMTPNEIEDMASYIKNEQEVETSNEIKEELEQLVEDNSSIEEQQPIAENLEGIKVGNLYTYHPSFLDIEGHENESKLAQLAKLDLACRVKDILITSKEEDEGLIKVTFDIAENEGKELPEFAKEDFIVFESDLSPYSGLIVSNDEQAEEPEQVDERIHVTEGKYPAEYKNMYNLALNVSESDVVKPEGDDFAVATDYHFDENGDIELIMHDSIDNDEWYKYIGKPHDWSAIKNLYLTTKDSTIDVPLELYFEVLNEYFKPEEEVKEDLELNPQDTDTSTALLTALNSEKEAVMTYEMLIKMSTDEEEIELLNKILEDEKEHVSLLSALQSKKTANSVAEDNKEQLDGYAEDVIQTPAAE